MRGKGEIAAPLAEAVLIRLVRSRHLRFKPCVVLNHISYERTDFPVSAASFLQSAFLLPAFERISHNKFSGGERDFRCRDGLN